MKRRNFLAGIIGTIGTIVTAPLVASQLPEPVLPRRIRGMQANSIICDDIQYLSPEAMSVIDEKTRREILQDIKVNQRFGWIKIRGS